jgi:hypothetical protein
MNILTDEDEAPGSITLVGVEVWSAGQDGTNNLETYPFYTVESRQTTPPPENVENVEIVE